MGSKPTRPSRQSLRCTGNYVWAAQGLFEYYGESLTELAGISKMVLSTVNLGPVDRDRTSHGRANSSVPASLAQDPEGLAGLGVAHLVARHARSQ